MSRKSSRLATRSKSTDQIPECNRVARKRKAEEDPEGAMEQTKRRQQYRIENQFVPISSSASITTCAIVPSPARSPHHSPSYDLQLGSKFRFQNYFTTPVNMRHSPLPQLDWADSQDVWQTMLRKELNYVRDHNLFDKHPSLQPRMRTILLDWLIEVCEVYRLHRETFYLAADFLDRYLSSQHDIQKHQLQLIGITSLFIAAKMEEIYPPKMAEFAYVTDGACTDDEILDQELLILKPVMYPKQAITIANSADPDQIAPSGAVWVGSTPIAQAINWNLTPVTTLGWLSVYLQVANAEQHGGEHGFIFPQYSSHVFVQIVRLLDLCVLDVENLQFTYSVLAASALYHMSSRELALTVSGYEWGDILPCVQWMAAFAVTVRELGQMQVKFFQNVPSEDSHNIQTHVVDISLLEKAHLRQEDLRYAEQGSPPDLQAQVITQLTPPQSDKKYPPSEATYS